MKLSEWSRYVVLRDGRCADCGRTDGLRAKRKGDGVCLCKTCHWKRHEKARVRVRRKSEG